MVAQRVVEGGQHISDLLQVHPVETLVRFCLSFKLIDHALSFLLYPAVLAVWEEMTISVLPTVGDRSALFAKFCPSCTIFPTSSTLSL